MYPKLSTGDNVSQSRNCAERVESFLYCVLAGQADGPANLGVMVAQSDWLFLSKGQVAAVEKADFVFSARVRELYIPLTQKEYWKIFWEQPVIAAAIVTPSQRELIPFFKNMLSIPAEDREHSQWQFGHPVTFADKSKASSP